MYKREYYIKICSITCVIHTVLQEHAILIHIGYKNIYFESIQFHPHDTMNKMGIYDLFGDTKCIHKRKEYQRNKQKKRRSLKIPLVKTLCRLYLNFFREIKLAISLWCPRVPVSVYAFQLPVTAHSMQ